MLLQPRSFAGTFQRFHHSCLAPSAAAREAPFSMATIQQAFHARPKPRFMLVSDLDHTMASTGTVEQQGVDQRL
jgi:hypothetical protein